MERLPDHIAELFFLNLQDGLSNKQQKELDDWLDENPYNRKVFDRTKTQKTVFKDLEVFQKFNVDLAWEKFEDSTFTKSKENTLPDRILNTPFLKWLAACAALLLISLAAYYFNNQFDTKYAVKVQQEINPASKGALLTLSNGKKVLLDTIQNGTIKLENGSTAEVIDGQLSYHQSENLNVINNISTTSGRYYQMILADGTKVWLNANSSISFPSVFHGTTRTVKIQGEVYFEVTKNREMPFIVEASNGLRIEVTGTKFNLNTYADESSWKTTLIEGKVNVHFDGKVVTLHPGGQAKVDLKKNILAMTDKVNTDKAVAWISGLFNFEDASLPEIMREIQRWYDVEVEYKGPIQQIGFFGEISRKESLEDVIRALQESGVKLKLHKERRLITIEQ